MWGELGNQGLWPMHGDTSWSLHNLPSILMTQENWRHRGDMGIPLHSAPAQEPCIRQAQPWPPSPWCWWHTGSSCPQGIGWLRKPLTSQSWQMSAQTQPNPWAQRSKGQVEPWLHLPALLPTGPPSSPAAALWPCPKSHHFLVSQCHP
jgi:hypothetical protein